MVLLHPLGYRDVISAPAYAADLPLDLADADLAQVEPVLENRPATLALTQGRLRGVVPARQVQVYRLVPAPYMTTRGHPRVASDATPVS